MSHTYLTGAMFECEACGYEYEDHPMAFAPHLCEPCEALEEADQEPYVPPDCMSCEDTGYEPGMPGYYCTFCKAGCKVATEQLKAGRDPFDPHGADQHKCAEQKGNE